MREHMGLFRGKRVDNGEWVKGSLLRDGEMHKPIDRPDLQFSDCYIVPKKGYDNVRAYLNDGILLNTHAFHVDLETVGECTGLKDKNGKLIFEGDVVAFKRVNALGYTASRIGDVRYYDKLPIFYIMATTEDAWDWCDCEEIEVIGNIHDNPELLGGEDA